MGEKDVLLLAWNTVPDELTRSLIVLALLATEDAEIVEGHKCVRMIVA